MIKASAKVKLAAVIFGAVLFLAADKVSAADFNIIPSSSTAGLNQTISVDIKINEASQSINAAQGVLAFNPDILQVKNISKANSIFNFWLTEPTFSNKDGKVEFLGGTPNGVAGGALQVLRIIFTASGVGSSDLTFTDSSVTAADGSGKNIISKTNGANFIVLTQDGVPLKGTPGPTPSGAVPTPEQISRTPAPASTSPVSSVIKVTLYNDPGQWYNLDAPFTASWTLPADISGVSTILNQNPTSESPAVSEGLFASKTFPALQNDGVYYLHVRFQNSKGWGPTAHYRIAMDTQPPLPFQINLKTGGLVSDDPAPTLSFRTGDSLSGIARYAIIVNSEAIVYSDKGEYKVPPHKPGDYNVVVRAIDQAGNSIDGKIKLEIVPIESPAVTFITNKVVGSDIIRIKGSARVGYKVEVSIETKNKSLVAQSEVSVDNNGQWSYQLDRTLNSGDYLATVVAKDSRDARSLPAGPTKISVTGTPILSLFGLDITLGGLTVFLVILVVIVFLYFMRKIMAHQLKTLRGSVVIGRDLGNAFNMIKKDLDKIVSIAGSSTPADQKKMEAGAINKKIQDSLDKIEKYLSEDIEKLR